MGKKEKYRKVKAAAKAQGRATKRTSKQTGKTIKRGAKTVARGVKQGQKAFAAESKGVTNPRRSKPSNKGESAAIKVQSGSKAMANPTPKKKIKKKAYTTTENVNYQDGRTGQKKYLTKKGRQTNRRGGRAKP